MGKATCTLLAGLVNCLGLILFVNVFVRDSSVVVVNYGQYVFREYLGRRGVFTKRDVCIEQHPDGSKQRVLVIYNAEHTSEREEVLEDNHSINSKYPGWPVFYQQGRIPEQHAIMDHPAFFVVTTCEGNLHHIIDDSLLGLYGLMEATGQLNKSTQSQVFTSSCRSTKQTSCHSYTRYLGLVQHLGVISESYGCLADHTQTNVCYRYAGFGFLEADKQQFYRYVTAQYGLGEGSCSSNAILLVDRSDRRVLNMAELALATTDTLALPNTLVEIVDFAGLSIEQQIRKVYCSHILVGVQGAGMQWLYFLPPHSAVLEIGWRRWPSKYTYRSRTVGVRAAFLDATDNITINWPHYQQVNKRHDLSDEEKRAILNDDNLLLNANPYKFADTHIGADVYLGYLKKLIKDLQRDGVTF